MNSEKKTPRSATGRNPGGGAHLLLAENNVIGMSLNDRTNLIRAWKLGVRSYHFAEPTNKVLWRALCAKTIDGLDAGYPILIEQLRESCPLTQNVEFYAAPLIVSHIELRFRERMASALRHFPPNAAEVARVMANLEKRMAKLRKWEGYLGERDESIVISQHCKRYKQKQKVQSRESRRRDLQADFDNLRQ